MELSQKKNALLAMDDQSWTEACPGGNGRSFAGVWVTPSVEDKRREAKGAAEVRLVVEAVVLLETR